MNIFYCLFGDFPLFSSSAYNSISDTRQRQRCKERKLLHLWELCCIMYIMNCFPALRCLFTDEIYWFVAFHKFVMQIIYEIHWFMWQLYCFLFERSCFVYIILVKIHIMYFYENLIGLSLSSSARIFKKIYICLHFKYSMPSADFSLVNFKIKLSLIPKDFYHDPCLFKLFALIVNH